MKNLKYYSLNFLNINVALCPPNPKVFDKAKSIKLIAKGNNQKYFVHLRTTGTLLPWQYYQSEFIVEENFKEFILPIKDFKKSGSLMLKKANPKKITSIGLVAYGRDHEAELTIKEIEFIN